MRLIWININVSLCYWQYIQKQMDKYILGENREKKLYCYLVHTQVEQCAFLKILLSHTDTVTVPSVSYSHRETQPHTRSHLTWSPRGLYIGASQHGTETLALPRTPYKLPCNLTHTKTKQNIFLV